MATQNDIEVPSVRIGAQPEQPASPGADRAAASRRGASGEGAGSAMARLISQEQARSVPGAPEDGATGSP